MTLKDLQELVNNIKTLGFEPDEVQVNIQYAYLNLGIGKVQTVVRADQNIKPVVQIELKA